MIRRPWALAALLPLLFALPRGPRADDPYGDEAVAAREWLETVAPSEPLQAFLHAAIESLRAKDAALRKQTIRVALIDLPARGAPRLAQWNGDLPVYPASVVKFVYLMAAFAWRDEGRLEIDADFDRQLRAMTYSSSNRATQRVVYRLTDTEPGPRLGPEDYADFRERRHRVKNWLRELGVDDLHTVHPTYDGGADLYGRDVQFLEDPDVEGSLPKHAGSFRNRQAMTANATARLLALLATDRALAPATSEEVRRRMLRDPRKQPYLVKRIAGGGDLREDIEIYTKTGSWGPIYADAGIARREDGHQLVIAVFVEGVPAYRGHFIAQISRAAIREILPPAGRPAGG